MCVLFESTGFPVPTLTSGCSNDNIFCLVPAAAGCHALNTVVEIGRLLRGRLNEGHLVCSRHSSQTLGAVATFQEKNIVFATAAGQSVKFPINALLGKMLNLFFFQQLEMQDIKLVK